MSGDFEIGGRLKIALQSLSESDSATITKALDPCPHSASAGPSDVLVASDHSVRRPFTDIQRNAGDGRVTATDGERFYVLERGSACAVPALDADPPATFAAEPGFPIGAAFGRLVRPRLLLALLGRRAVAAHAAAVEIGGRAVLVAGWSESGKTETALALMEGGARFLSDKWTVLADDATTSVFPITVGIRGWALSHLPRLDEALGASARRRFQAARVMRAVSRPVARGPTSDLRERALTLADRVAVSPSELRRLYGDDPSAPWQAPLGTVVLLRTVPPEAGVSARRIDPAWAAHRLTLTASFERRSVFELHDRAKWSAPQPDHTLRERLMLRERTLLEEVLAPVSVIEVSAPFPTDPRPVADEITRWL
jgi:hypothetical protein